jgi:hypothetical protein
MKKIVYDAVTNDVTLLSLIPVAQWVASSMADETTPRPFAAIRWGTRGRGVTSTTGSCDLQVWVHDEPGSYDTIDAAIRRLKSVLPAVEGVTDGTEYVACIRWEDESGELADDIRRTITRNIRFTVIGRD